MRKENATLARERDVLPKGDEVFRLRDDLVTSRFQFTDDQRGTFPVKRLCQVLGVVRSSCCKWRASRESRARRERDDEVPAMRIRSVHAGAVGTYGARRITAGLRQAPGLRINERKVARVMRKFRIAGLRLRKRVRTTVPEPSQTPVADLFQRDFT
ncbi:IS3 family transposase, partial [Streptomyces sp. NPDC059003]|uniref:IS3 family transposase n=1 Tax=Streptomyces sp. NPDC059003 TaxID=3346691 RepID=UPI0036878D1C